MRIEVLLLLDGGVGAGFGIGEHLLSLDVKLVDGILLVAPHVVVVTVASVFLYVKFGIFLDFRKLVFCIFKV
jgi:hypothetical protein